MRAWSWVLLGTGAVAVVGAGHIAIPKPAIPKPADPAAEPLATEPVSAAGPPLHVVERGGGGRTLVFLPGVGGTTRYWDSRVVPLAADHRLVLVDPLGFGLSAKPDTVYSVERHVAELHRVLAGRGRVTLVGHSFGALLAVAYAARHPHGIDGLVLVGLPYFGNEELALAHFGRSRVPERWLMTNVGLAAATCIVTRRVVGRALPRLLPDFPREVAEDLVQHTWRSSKSTLWEVVYRYDAAPDAARLPDTLPILMLHGDRDETAPLAGARRLMQGRRLWQLAVRPGGDHHLLLRDPAWVVAKIQSFLNATQRKVGATASPA